MLKNYRLIEHTADIGIRLRAKTLKGVFVSAARAVFDIAAEKTNLKVSSPKKIRLRLRADNPEELLVNWLNELLSLSAVKDLIFTDFKIDRFNNRSLCATVTGSAMSNYRVNTEIKAATYHQLKLRKSSSGGWEAEVILDV